MANHFCNSGADVETTKNGKPTATASRASMPNIGYSVPCGASDRSTASGECVGPNAEARPRATIATPRMPAWTAICRRELSRDVMA